MAGAAVAALLLGGFAGMVFGNVLELGALLPRESLRYVAGGVVSAVLALALALRFHGRLLQRAAGAVVADPKLAARLEGGRLQALLAAAFVLKLLALLAGVLVLRANGVKFSDLAAFAIAFAAASLICQVVAAGSLVRHASNRSASRIGAPTPAASLVSPSVPSGAGLSSTSHPS
jgi:hypothetical protein